MKKRGLEYKGIAMEFSRVFLSKMLVRFEAFGLLCFSVYKNKWKKTRKQFVSGIDGCE